MCWRSTSGGRCSTKGDPVPLVDYGAHTPDLYCNACKASYPKPGYRERPADDCAYPRQPGDDILKGRGYARVDLPLDWENPNR